MSETPADDQGWKGGGNSADRDPMHRLLRRISDLDKKIRESLRRTLQAAGISLSPEGMHIASSLDVSGDLNATGSASFGGDTDISGDLDVTGRANFSGNTTIGGNAAITGTLSLPAGIINNDALTSPIAYRADFDNSPSPLNLTGAEKTFATVTFNVPDGYTSALVVASASIGVMNPTANRSSFAGRIYIERSGGFKSWSGRWFQMAEPNWDAGTFPNVQSVVPVSGGDTITVRLVILNTGTNWGSTPGGATLNAFAIFTR